ncbi:uncharacterized protein METZ01_LOCUS257140 [marine metagenome]|uniref:Adenylate kinase active site lid domain-containing protein n=1 Tax=marine metagenome TaxID=408172 RepID=A0A382IXD1_9ZZZZ
MILIFFGPPGAGKGTQASLIANNFNIPHLSTGDILRDKLLQKDGLSTRLKHIMDKGQLVSDDILNEIVSNRISNYDCLRGFILDGYPRTMGQALFLNTILNSKNLKIDKIIDINIDERIIAKRIISRFKTENRQDDTEDVIKTRISRYLSETKPLSDFYKSKYFSDYLVINGNQEIEKIAEDIVKILKNDKL